MSVKPTQYQARKAAGLCTVCGGCPSLPSKATCEACAERARATVAARRAEARALGLCTQCVRRKAVTGRGGHCVLCADTQAARLKIFFAAKRAARGAKV